MASTSTRLKRIRVRGFRSLRDVSLDFTPVTVLIGLNGAGKSNLLLALEMVRMIALEQLQLFVCARGGASQLMHNGPNPALTIECRLEFSTEQGEFTYDVRLGLETANDSLTFLYEYVGFKSRPEHCWDWFDLGYRHKESKLKFAKSDAAKTVYRLLLDIVNPDNDYPQTDSCNLAAFLYRLRNSENQAAWRLIEGTVKRIVPCISELVLKPDPDGIKIEWLDDTQTKLGPTHLSYSSLRAIKLITALGQSSATRPFVSCIDGPELGLNSKAINILCSLISSVSASSQVIVATQSPTVLDCFEPSQVVIVERHEGASRLTRLDEETLKPWLEECT